LPEYTTVKTLLLAAALLAITIGSGTPVAAREFPQETPEGLVLRKSKVADAVYVRPGVDFSVYNRIAILECPVAFRKDWERDQQRKSMARVSSKDMEEIKAGLSAEFRKVFVEELQDKGGYQVVETGGDDVLVIRPAIINLDVTAPDTMTAGRSYTLSESAGEMTLYIELYDSVTGQLLAKAIDRRSDPGMGGTIQWRNGVTNKADADRMLRRWAKALRERLDEVHGKQP
jgi:hypothetical protein